MNFTIFQVKSRNRILLTNITSNYHFRLFSFFILSVQGFTHNWTSLFMYFFFLSFLRGRIRRRGQKLCEHYFNDDDSNRTVLQRVTHVQFAWKSAADWASLTCCMQILAFSAVLDFSFLCEAPLYFSWTVLHKRDVTLLSVVGFAVAIGIIPLFWSFGKIDLFFVGVRGAVKMSLTSS